MKRTFRIMRTPSIAFALFLVPVLTTAQSAADSAAIRATALNYIEGWYEGNGERMKSALHPKLAKRMVYPDQIGKSALNDQTAETLIQGTRRGGGSSTPAAQQRTEVTILDIYGNAASVRVDAGDWIDYLHIVRFDTEWKIINVLWELRTEAKERMTRRGS